MVGGVMELDLHGMNTYQAQIAIDAALRRRGGGVHPPRPRRRGPRRLRGWRAPTGMGRSMLVRRV